VIDLTDHDVEVRAADIDEVRITTELTISGLGAHKAERWIAAHTPEVTDGKDELRVTARPEGTGFLAFGYLTARARVRVLLPSTAVPDITTSGGDIHVRGDLLLAEPLRLRTATGAIRFDGAALAVDVRTVSGDVELDMMRPLRSLFARTSSGSVSLVGGARSVEIDTASGDVQLDSLSGSARVTTTTGRISTRWDRLDAGQAVTIRSATGPVTVTIPATADPHGTITTTGGAIGCDVPSAVHESDRSVRLTGAGATIDVETASGAVEVAIGDSWEPPLPP
jgi:hypothetical protein